MAHKNQNEASEQLLAAGTVVAAGNTAMAFRYHNHQRRAEQQLVYNTEKQEENAKALLSHREASDRAFKEAAKREVPLKMSAMGKHLNFTDHINGQILDMNKSTLAMNDTTLKRNIKIHKIRKGVAIGGAALGAAEIAGGFYLRRRNGKTQRVKKPGKRK